MADIPRDVLEWLLEDTQPAVAYRALTELLEYEAGEPRVRHVRARIPGCADVERLFVHMRPDGTWKIGKRGAQKMVLELKPKLTTIEVDSVVGTSPVAQVRDALEGLGYQSAEIREVMASIDGEAPVSEQLRQALRSLGRQ